MNSNHPNVAIIGGGYAGLAAAIELAHQGISITLYETSHILGGRARRVEWQHHHLDNGQHILLGAYRETLRLLALISPNPQDNLERLPLALVMHGEFTLQAPKLPAPVHILIGLLGSQGLSVQDRLAALRWMAYLRLTQFKLKNDIPLLSLLNSQHQSEKLIRVLWEPLCLAALNTPIAVASAKVFLNVLRDSFSHARSNSDLLIPSTDLTNLLPTPAAAFIRAHNGKIETGIPIEKVTSTTTGFNLHHDAEITEATHVIMAVPAHRLKALTIELPMLSDSINAASALQYQPITTIYLQYAPTVSLPRPMTGLLGGYGQWVFDRGPLTHQAGLLAVVISAEGPHAAFSQGELAAKIQAELQAAFPHLGKPEWTKVITEKRATFACTPNLNRPSQRTALERCYLAGDYTAGEYPSTIEGAVQSGVKCAQLILNDLKETQI